MNLNKTKIICPICKSRMMWRDREACGFCRKNEVHKSSKESDSRAIDRNFLCFRCGEQGKISYGKLRICRDCLKIQYAQNLPILHRRPAKRVWWNRETDGDNFFEENVKAIEHWGEIY